MSETHDGATGQFAGAEPLYGEAAANAALGYTNKLDDNPPERGPEDSKELAETLADARLENLTIEQQVRTEQPEPVLGLTKEDDGEPKEALTQKQLTEEIADRRTMHERDVERRGNEEVAAHADWVRAYMNGDDLAPAQNAEQPVKAEAAAETSVDGLAPDLAKAIEHPQVREWIAVERDRAVAETVQAKEAYTKSLQHGQQMLQATVAALAPQLQSVPLEQWPQAIQQLAQVDPVRANLVAETLHKWGAIQQAQQQEQQQHAELARQQFEAQRKEWSQKSDEAIGPMSFAEKAELVEDMVGYVGEYGITREQLLHEAETNLALHHPAFNAMMADAVRYRRLMKAPKAVATRNVPPVQRPGAAPSPAERVSRSQNDRTAKASARINSGNGTVKDIGDIIGALRRG